MTYTLTINPIYAELQTTEHDSLRDARAALIRHFARRGMHITIKPWFAFDGQAVQYGALMSGGTDVGGWNISYPIEDGAELPPYQVEGISA